MLREEDIRIDVGRASHGGDFMRLTHVPTGLFRLHPGPLADVNRHELTQKWLAEIERELQEHGLSRRIVPEYRTKSTLRRRPRQRHPTIGGPQSRSAIEGAYSRRFGSEDDRSHFRAFLDGAIGHFRRGFVRRPES
jgi:hypothetical protein